ncbi:dihydrolipoyl dehydrogenase [Candidatus Peregrinibacteria bacterium]|nr:MAG: dihydrolipoyl dehydrogenase [Candidatus Peregrinibacteria bacterium]
MSEKFDLIVIGAGSGGLVSALGANYLGAKVLLIEKGKLGGDCLNYGCVPSKALIRSAHVAHAIKNAKNFGISVEKSSIDFSAVITRVQNIIQNIATTHDSKERFESLGIRVIMGTSTFLNSHEVLLNDKTYFGKKIVIATGGRANRPNIEGLEKTGYLTNEELFSIKKSPKSLIILGGGAIGSEMAQAFSRLGVQVTIVDKSSTILSREDTDVAEVIMKKFKREGIQIEVNALPIKVHTDGTQKYVTIQQNGENKILQAEEILVALGRKPNIEGLQLEAAGVKYDKKGIQVNSHQQTSKKHIYACGDICGPFLFTHMASYQAGIIVKNAFTPLSAKASYHAFPWCTFLDPEVAHVGLSEKQVTEQGIFHTIHKSPVSTVDRARADGENEGFIKIILGKKGKILGVTIVAPHAGELLAEYTLAMNKGLKIQDIYDTIHIYPTMSELNKFGASQYMKTLFSPFMKTFLGWWNGFEKNK